MAAGVYVRQYVVTTSDGRAYGLVLDTSPMLPDAAARHVEHFGARLPGDLVAWARHVAGDRHGWTLGELVYRPRRFSTAGRARRRYPEQAFVRLVESPAAALVA
jgi:hypothetical protein